MIDPGHGGRDIGTMGKKHREKDTTLALARRLVRALRKKGYVVNMTRWTDADVSLARRAKLAKSWKADVFISLHCNSVASKTVTGTETFILPPKGTSSTYAKKPQTKSYSGNRFNKENARLAFEIQRGFVAAAGTRDRGVKHARFVVVRDAPCPSVLVETGFLSNTSEERKLANPVEQEKMVRGLVVGIVRYHRALLKK